VEPQINGDGKTMSTEQTIREITRKEYDNLVAEQQAFFDAVIKEGRARIVETGTAPAAKMGPNHPARPERPCDPICQLRGQRVTAILINGSTISSSTARSCSSTHCSLSRQATDDPSWRGRGHPSNTPQQTAPSSYSVSKISRNGLPSNPVLSKSSPTVAYGPIQRSGVLAFSTKSN
jgi:hypothetical protein